MEQWGVGVGVMKVVRVGVHRQVALVVPTMFMVPLSRWC